MSKGETSLPWPQRATRLFSTVGPFYVDRFRTGGMPQGGSRLPRSISTLLRNAPSYPVGSGWL